MLIDISYRTKHLQKVCEDASEAKKKYGADMAKKIHQRIDEIRASESVEMMVKFGIGRCHPLTEDRKGQFAMDLTQPYRLIFEKSGEIVAVEIREIVDYHK